MSNPSSPNWKEIFTLLGRTISRHWGYKLLSLVLAMVIWAVLIAQDPSITREKTLNDVPVTVSGTDYLKRNGFVVTSNLSEQLTGVTLRASVPQMQYQNVQSSSFNPRVDLSRITSAGTQEVRIQTTNSTTYGSVIEIEPDTVEIKVEEYITRNRIPIVRETSGEMPEGWYATSSTLDPAILTISGPRSLVESVVRAEAVFDLSMVMPTEGIQRTSVPFRLVNAAGETVESKLIEVTSLSVLVDSVIVEQNVYPTKTLEFSQTGVVTGTPAAGYEVKSVTFSPEKIRAAGRSDTLENLDSIFTDLSVDVTDATQSFSQTLRLRKPSELTYLSQDTVTVSVEIGEIISERTFSDVRINAVGADADLTATLEERYADLVSVEGTQNWLNTLRNNQISLTVDVSELGPGTYVLPVICDITDDGGQEYTVKTSPAMVTVTIRER